MNVINRSRKQGMSLLPVLALSAVLSALLLVATNYKATASQEDLTQRKMAATSAINMAAVDLRTDGSLPAEKTVTVDGVNVLVRGTLGADGNTMKISADGQGEVVQATAVREVAQASNAGAAPQTAYAGNAPQADFSAIASKTYSASAAPQTIGTPGGWVIFNADNVIISKDSANRGAILEAIAAKEEAARQAAAAAEQARVDAINAENTRVAQAQAEAAAYASKMAVFRDATDPAASNTPSATLGATVDALMRLMASWQGIKGGGVKLEGIYGGTPMGPAGPMSDSYRF